MTTLRAKPALRPTVIAAGCLLCLPLALPGPVAAQPVGALAGTPPIAGASGLAPPGSGGSAVYRDFDRFRAHARFDRAFRLLAANRLGDAARDFDDGLALDPDHLAARLGYAQLLAKRGAYDASVAQLDVLEQRDGVVLPALQLRAQMQAAAGRLRAAITDQTAVAAHPLATAAERRFAIETTADLHLRLGEYDRALGALDRLPADRSDAQTLVRRALAYEKLQRYGEAAEAYRMAASQADDAARRAQWADAAKVALAMAEEGSKTQGAVAALNLGGFDPAGLRTASVSNAGTMPPDARQAPPGAVPQTHAAPASGIAAEPRARRPRAAAPHGPAAWRQAAWMHSERGAHAEARDALQHLVALAPADAEGHAALARAHLALGEHAAAVTAAQRSLALRSSAAAHRLLAFAHASAGDWRAAADTEETLLGLRGLRPAERVERLGRLAYALDRLQDYRGAAAALERATAEPGGDTIDMHERLAHARAQAGDVEGVADALRRALAVPSASDEDRVSIGRRLAVVQRDLGRKDEAIDTYRALRTRTPDDAQLQLDLGILLRSHGRWEEAQPLLAAAFGANGDATAALELARGLKADRRAVEAIDVLQRAAEAEAAPDLRKQIHDELGYLREGQGEPARAATAWSTSLTIAYDPRIATALASVQLRAGQRDAARATLDALAEGQGADVQAAGLGLRWQLENAEGRHAAARDVAAQLLALQATPPARFRLALSERALGHLPQSIEQLEQAVAEDPKTEYLDTLAYAYRAAGSYAQAAQSFETLLERDPQRQPLYADLAYTYMRMGDNDRALEWFKRAIDKRRERTATVQLAQAPGAPLPAIERPREDEDVRALRDEVRKLSETWSLSAYQSVRGGSGDRPSTVSGFDSSGLIPSQGGVELAWRPPVIGLRDERTLDVFARMLWSNEPGSLRIQGASRQAGVGVRFKPLREQSLYFTVERLIKIGDNAQDDWLLRASYGWSDGYEMRANQDAWNYTTLFADVGAFTDPLHTRALYLEGRQGRSYRVGDRWIVTPHVVANGRRQWPDPGRTNYAEAGAGVSVRYLFNETAYATPRSSAEVLLHYKKGFAAVKSGWLLTTVLRF